MTFKKTKSEVVYNAKTRELIDSAFRGMPAKDLAAIDLRILQRGEDVTTESREAEVYSLIRRLARMALRVQLAMN